MNRTILVPIDISDSELTQRVISHVEEEAKIDDAEVHFLTVIPSLPYYASLGLAYSAELPAMDDRGVASGNPQCRHRAHRRTTDCQTVIKQPLFFGYCRT